MCRTQMIISNILCAIQALLPFYKCRQPKKIVLFFLNNTCKVSGHHDLKKPPTASMFSLAIFSPIDCVVKRGKHEN